MTGLTSGGQNGTTKGLPDLQAARCEDAAQFDHPTDGRFVVVSATRRLDRLELRQGQQSTSDR